MFHPAKKLVVITEHFVSEKVCKIIESGGGRGYTMVPAGGKGLHHLHPTLEKATVVEGFDNLKFEVVLSDKNKAEAIAHRILSECFEEYPGVMYLEDVEICRPDRF
jgi:nitrogen regulatory protein PII